MAHIVPHPFGECNGEFNFAEIPNLLVERDCRTRRAENESPAENAEDAESGLDASRPLSPTAKRGEAVYGMETGTPIPDGFQATRWNRRIRNAPMATRGTDARPNTSSARKRSFAHISCVGLRHPSDRRESTPVSNTCHSV